MTEIDNVEAASRDADPSARRWKVFVSSTSSGLDGLREIARDVIEGFAYEGVPCFEPVMMENFGAQAGPAREICAREMQGCDVVVGIIGIRYGAHPRDDQTSYTELEFQTAVKLQLPRLMFLLEDELAHELERNAPQGEDRADRQAQFRDLVGADLVAEMHVRTAEDFREKLTRDLKKWVEEYSFTREMVDHRDQFLDARERLRGLDWRIGEATLIFGEPGTGKTKLLKALIDDVPVRHTYKRLVGPLPVWLADGREAVEQVRAQVSAELDGFTEQAGGSVTPPPVLIALQLEADLNTGRDVDPDTLSALPRLFSWDGRRTVVLAETNNRPVMEHLEDDLGWSLDAVVTVSDYVSVGDALEQMRRDAPGVRQWPQPDTRILAEALGLRPISLFAAAKDIEREARRSPRRVPAKIQQQLAAIAGEQSPAGKYSALLRNSIDHLSPQARKLLALMTVLHPKPTVFRDEIAVALDLSLDLEEAVGIATAEDDEELDADGVRNRDRAYQLVGELVERGLLERVPRARDGDGGQDSPELLTLHPANVRVIHDYLPLTDDTRAEAHARAEAFYRARVGQTVSGSFDSRFRMENEAWWDDAEEWLYHSSHVAPDQAAIGFATLFLDAFWWWDAYVRFDFCDKLLDYAKRPRVQAISTDMPEVTQLLTRFRQTYPREHEANRAEILAEIAGDDPVRAAAVRQTASTGAGVLPILHDLCGHLGIAELDALFTSAAPPETASAAPGDEPDLDQTRLHLLGLICVFLAEGHRFVTYSPAEAGEAALAAAEACYRRAESYFLAEEDFWDVAWTRCLLGEVISLRGGDPVPVWDQATEGGIKDSDTELLGDIEQARAAHLRTDDLEGALAHYGRAVFYGLALQATSNLEQGADAFTQAFYRELCLDATRILAMSLLADQETALDDRVAETERRLGVMLGEWGGHWKPDPAALDDALRTASRETAEQAADAIAAAAFPPGPGDAVLGKPGSRYYRWLDNFIEKTSTQPWIRGLDRWAEHRKPQAGTDPQQDNL
jgi:hypothetical protein